MRISTNELNEASYEHHLKAYLASRSKKMVFLQNNGRVLFLLLVVTEFSLALAGFDPGRTSYDENFSVVNELVEFEGYSADNRGIMYVDVNARNYARDYIKAHELGNKLLFQAALNYEQKHYTPYRVGRDFLEITQGEVQTEFSRFIKKIESSTEPSSDNKAILAYMKSPINSDGFRSIEFENVSTNKQKIFLLGDSFTWGSGVENLSASFADDLTSRGFLVYNSGIVGTDLPQYAEIARKYIQTVKPDVVVLNLFLGNDIAEHRIVLKPFLSQYYNTNAGTLMSAPHGKVAKNAEEAYARIIDQMMIPKKMSWVNFVASQTRISTLFWGIFVKMGIIGNVASKKSENYWDFVNQSKVGYIVNAEILADIEQICEKNKCELIVSIIPERDNLAISKHMVDKMVVNFPYVRISNLTKEDYASDGHFNESGSRKYAGFIEVKIQK
ncbi:MAG: hypothetical protein ACI865_003296 [Flavobacteriaceae bacterium]|jgi:hypothetical protein